MLISHDVIFIENDFSESAKIQKNLDLIKYENTRICTGSPKSCPLCLIEGNFTDRSTIPVGQPLVVYSQNSSTNEIEESSKSQWLDSPKQSQPAHTMVTRSQAEVRRPNPRYALQVSAQTLPQNIKEAKASPEWNHEMISEMEALKRNRTWKLIPRTLEHNVLHCKWIYRLKQDKKGKITHHKARLVANGMCQIDGIDVQDTSNPVIKPSTI